MKYQTEQEEFWAGEFGNAYIEWNRDEQLVNILAVLFGDILKRAPNVQSILELGCNIGLNLRALRQIRPDLELCGYEINEIAYNIAKAHGIAEIAHHTIIQPISTDKTYDLVFTRCVLIHINPANLRSVYRNLYELSNRYVLVCEFYNPTPVVVNYRGHDERLYKRDFAGELMEEFGLKLIGYGFWYHRDNYFPQADVTWFLMEK